MTGDTAHLENRQDVLLGEHRPGSFQGRRSALVDPIPDDLHLIRSELGTYRRHRARSDLVHQEATRRVTCGDRGTRLSTFEQGTAAAQVQLALRGLLAMALHALFLENWKDH